MIEPLILPDEAQDEEEVARTQARASDWMVASRAAPEKLRLTQDQLRDFLAARATKRGHVCFTRSERYRVRLVTVWLSNPPSLTRIRERKPT